MINLQQKPLGRGEVSPAMSSAYSLKNICMLALTLVAGLGLIVISKNWTTISTENNLPFGHPAIIPSLHEFTSNNHIFAINPSEECPFIKRMVSRQNAKPNVHGKTLFPRGDVDDGKKMNYQLARKDPSELAQKEGRVFRVPVGPSSLLSRQSVTTSHAIFNPFRPLQPRKVEKQPQEASDSQSCDLDGVEEEEPPTLQPSLPQQSNDPFTRPQNPVMKTIGLGRRKIECRERVEALAHEEEDEEQREIDELGQLFKGTMNFDVKSHIKEVGQRDISKCPHYQHILAAQQEQEESFDKKRKVPGNRRPPPF